MRTENGLFGGSTWLWSKGDASWLAQNLWDHYAFTGDKKYLRERVYPVQRDLCEYWLSDLKELPDGRLVSPNGFSPEHGPHEDPVAREDQALGGHEPDVIARLLDLSSLAALRHELADDLRAAQRSGEVRGDVDADELAIGIESMVLALLMGIVQANVSDLRRSRGVVAMFEAALTRER